MAKNKNSKYDSSKDPIVVSFIFILIIAAVCLVYWNLRGILHPLYYSIKYYQLYPFYFFMPELKEYLYGDIQSSGVYNLEEMIDGAAYYGKYAFWTLFPIAVYLLFKVNNKYTFKNKKLQDGKIGSEELLRLNAKVHAIVRPVAQRNIREMSPNVGPWRFADTPLFFAVKNNLLYDWKGNPFRLSELYNNVPDDMNDPRFAFAPLVDPRLNCIYLGQKNFFHFDRAYNIFLEQLGTKILFNNIQKCFLDEAEGAGIPPWKLVLAGIYYRFGTSQKDKENLAYPWMDKMATLCGGNDELTIKKFSSITVKDVGTLWAGHKENEKFVNFITNGASFERPFFMHMVAWAKGGGKITPSEFVWLRAIERTLYYSINQVGGRTAHSESLGPWMHYVAERFIGESLHLPYVMTASQSMYMSLYREGYLPYREFEEENQYLPGEVRRVMESVNLTGEGVFSGGIAPKDSLETKQYKPEMEKKSEVEEQEIVIKTVSVSDKINELKKKLTIPLEIFYYFQSPPRFVVNYPIKKSLSEEKWEQREKALRKYQQYSSLPITNCEWCGKTVKSEKSNEENQIHIVPLWEIDDEHGIFTLKSLNCLCFHCWIRQYYLHLEFIAQKAEKKEEVSQAYTIVISTVESLFKITTEEFEKNLDIMRQIRDLREKKAWKLGGCLDEMILSQPEKKVVDGIVQK